MNILEIHCESYATRVAYAAAHQLYNLLIVPLDADDEDFHPREFLPIEDPGELEGCIQGMGGYVCFKGCETGERLYRWLMGQRLFGKSWETLDQELVLTFETFVQVCSSTYTKLHCRQIEAERRDQVAQAAKPLPIEDTIFEPIGSMSELLPHAVEASKAIADYQRATAEAAAAEQNENQANEPGGALSLGENVHSASAGQSGVPETGREPAQEPDLPPAPKTPAQRKGRSSTAKRQK
ncbi:hypothetical protein FMN63_25015 [Stappia sp. BW2]|uniref:hypothetical protein n=1 Tax=Stappia sp. BW2 TaxID=2592622 RepID=UPI0011DEBF7E|nr:hypothetical protein [Stappia sp. BW2]TYC65647.1 hypothetical protein FMN63_25015 [Stappia sp. BW2]